MVLRNAIALELGALRWAMVVVFPLAALVPLWLGTGEPALQLAQAFAIGIATPVVLNYIASQELVIDDGGIRYRAALPGPLERLSPTWAMPWSELRRVDWGRGIASHELVLFGERGRLRVDAGAFHATREAAREWRRQRAKDRSRLPMVAALRQRGVEVPDVSGPVPAP
jgi:hypothetical protein